MLNIFVNHYPENSPYLSSQIISTGSVLLVLCMIFSSVVVVSSIIIFVIVAVVSFYQIQEKCVMETSWRKSREKVTFTFCVVLFSTTFLIVSNKEKGTSNRTKQSFQNWIVYTHFLFLLSPLYLKHNTTTKTTEDEGS